MKRLILAAVAALALAGCAAPVKQDMAGVAPVRFSAVATLATNSCEVTTAPAYTAVVVLANEATKRLQAGAMSVEAAQYVLEQGRAARTALDAACKGGTLNQPQFDRAQVAVRAMQGAMQ